MLEYVGYFSENLILRRAENGSSLLDLSDLAELLRSRYIVKNAIEVIVMFNNV